MSVFDLTMPAMARTAVVVEVPHAGLAIPDAVRDELLVDGSALERDADLFVDKLYARAPEVGAPLLAARISRYVVDLNRSPDDVDVLTVADHPAPRLSQPRGVIWRVTTDGQPVLARPLDRARLQFRLESYHAPYHRQLRALLDETQARFGFVVLVAGHSMPSTARPASGGSGVRRADVVPGSLGGTSAGARVLDEVDRHFRAAGLTVRHDDPYRGAFTTAHYGKPSAGRHVVQLEINRDLYMDEETCTPRAGDVARLQALLRELVERLGRLDLSD